MKSFISVITVILINSNINVGAFYVKMLSENSVEENVAISCTNDEYCIGLGFKGLKCVNGICQCKEKTSCQKISIPRVITKIDKYCNFSFECYMHNSYCFQAKCTCINGTISSKDKRRCLKVNEELDSGCEEDGQCDKLNAFCMNKRCKCSPRMHNKNGICYKSIELDSHCERNEQCSLTEFTECKNNTCKCDENHVRSKNNSMCFLKAVRIFSSCVESTQCSSTLGHGVYCDDGLCKCLELYNYRNTTNKCVLDVLLNNECGDHSDCHEPNKEEKRLECILGVCKCKLPYFEKDGYCVKSKLR
ncbi:hypothetical protein FQA39_LY13168 [Lamprigera yunnana]|nr:hypothetical protein FQA39_LY13168 [Lamprigera yunnana]